MKMLVRGVREVCLVAGLVSAAQFSLSATPAAPCTLQWQPSSSPAVAGYAVYYGVSGSSLTNRLDAGSSQSFTLNNLAASSNYFFFVVAYNTTGVESPPSNVLYYRPAVLTLLRIAELTDGTMNIRFRAGTGATCRVQYTSSLDSGQWTTLGTATASSSGDVIINDPPAGRPDIRFYRGVTP